MKLSVLHISDLHRDPENPIRNDVLLDCLEVDRRHYAAEETPAVRSPDLIIVSGDIIQGIRADEPDPDKKLREQYQEAFDFLSRLADRFVGGDRDRVVIVPGNHDVSAYHFQRSLRRVAEVRLEGEDWTDVSPEDDSSRKSEHSRGLLAPGSPRYNSLA
jgi:3',5'-cyclic AMP phosphodiesterase CpdA